MNKKHNIFSLGFAIITLIACVIGVFYLPNIIPTHWNIQGEIDGYGSKYILLVGGVLGLGTYVLMNATKKIDPLENKIDEKINVYYLIRDILVLLLSCMGWVMLLASAIPGFDVARYLNVVLGCGFVVLGNYMPRIPHNYFLGAKTPWALADENNWKQTQRMSGYVFCLGGLLMMSCLFINQIYSFIISMIVVLGGTFWVYYYSYLLHKKSKNNIS